MGADQVPVRTDGDQSIPGSVERADRSAEACGGATGAGTRRQGAARIGATGHPSLYGRVCELFRSDRGPAVALSGRERSCPDPARSAYRRCPTLPHSRRRLVCLCSLTGTTPTMACGTSIVRSDGLHSALDVAPGWVSVQWSVHEAAPEDFFRRSYCL